MKSCYCSTKKEKSKRKTKSKTKSKRTSTRPGPIRGRERSSFKCMEPCNKLGFFATSDWAFDRIFRELPESNTTCRCPNAKRMDQPFIHQGRSCQCMIRPSGQRPSSCGCNNVVTRKVHQQPKRAIKPRTKECPFLWPKDYQIYKKRCAC